MLEEMNVIFKDVVNLSRDYRLYYEKHSVGGSPEDIREFIKTPEGQERKRRKELLDNYMDELDFETIKTLQVIMYLGRDRDYNKQDTPEEIYRKEREYFDSQGWNTKSIETDQMTSKVPFGQFLEEGLEILQIRY
ncbi:hypothetical protein ACQVWG_05770 [Bacillus cereus]|uniref:hypothetical protein n=1 Tax=Bacillus cereus TaxID=1396 RepID=UPI003D64A223|nr:DUF3775 domain-containing protein [Bacillus cereus]MDA2552295.1 DUF3775 domain-containing protein [Bacillus cereus]